MMSFMMSCDIITYEVKSNYEIVKSVAKLKFEILLSSGISLWHLRCHFLNVISYKDNYRQECIRVANARLEVIIFCKSRPSDCNNSH